MGKHMTKNEYFYFPCKCGGKSLGSHGFRRMVHVKRDKDLICMCCGSKKKFKRAYERKGYRMRG